MPPRAVKKGPGMGRKTATKATKPAADQPMKQADATEETERVKEVEVKDEIKVEAIVEAKHEERSTETKAPVNCSASGEDVTKDVSEEEDRGERLELDDNEAEYEPEEETAVEYDEKTIDDDGQEVDEVEEDVEEGDLAEDGEGEMIEEEIEDGGEDVEDDGDPENEEHEVDGEEEEHHEVVKERRKRKEFEVFVGGLDKDATEDDLRKSFSEVGEITEIRLLMNPQTKKNKGFAFLRFATVDQAKHCVTDFKNPVINGKQCGVAPSQDSDTLFLGNICKTWTKDHLKEKLKKYGVDKTEDLVLVEDASNEGMNRGFAFLEFSSRSDAMDAYRRLQKRDVVFGVDRSAKVAFADSFIEPDDEIMSQVKTVFIDGIPPAWDEDRALELVKKYGKIEKIELARNMPAAKRKDFGFVTFDTHEAAVACAEGINNAEVGDKVNKVKIRARLSRPLQRGRGKRVARGDFRIGRVPSREIHATWNRIPARRFPGRATRGTIGRGALVGGRVPKRPLGFRERRPVPAIPARARPLPPPERPYERRPPVLTYPRSTTRREYDRRDEIASRSRSVTEYGSRIHTERRQPYGDVLSRGGGYPEMPPRTLSRSAERRPYVDEGYGRKLERPLPSYREGRSREYDSLSGSKRPYSALDDVHPRYADVGARHSRARLDYGGGGAANFEDSYGERLGRSHMGYSSSRSSLSAHDSQGLYGSRHGINYGSVGESDGGMYSSGYNSNYLSRGADVSRRSDVGGSSYSAMYSGRNLSDTSYLRGGGSGGSYY